MNELHGEKIDIVDWSDDPATLVGNALSPARVSSVTVVDEAARSARVVVPDFQLSLAIGKEGQNARLAARLTGWRIDIRSDTEPEVPVAPPLPAALTSAVARSSRRPGTRWSSSPVLHSGKSKTATISCSGYVGGAGQRRTSSPSTREDRLVGVPVDGVGVELGDVDRQPRRGEVLGQVGVADLLEPDADLGGLTGYDVLAEDLGHADLPALLGLLLEAAQPERRHRARRDVIRHRISRWPPACRWPAKSVCSSRTSWPGVDGLLPVVLPTGPERLPLWTPESRSGGEWSSGSHSPWSGGMSRTRHESSRRYDARVASRELHIGR